MFKNPRLLFVFRIIIISVAIAIILLILWIDINTTIWQNQVILSGIAASVVSFLGTYIAVNLVLDRIKEKRWAPVTGLALADIMVSLADQESSEVTRGIIVPRQLKLPAISEINIKGSDIALSNVLSDIHDERIALTERLARWSQFLASSGNNDQIMQHVASASLQLERLRDVIIEAVKDELISDEQYEDLLKHTSIYNHHLVDLIDEIEQRLHSYRITQQRS